jgi:hypothetical protein
MAQDDPGEGLHEVLPGVGSGCGARAVGGAPAR